MLLLFTISQLQRVAAQGVAPVLRGRALEIVDDHGRVRASIQVLPASTQNDGQRSPETVLLRLITEKGRPSVKIGSSEESAGSMHITATVLSPDRRARRQDGAESE